MKVANGVEMLEISASIMGSQSIIHPTLIWDDNVLILVDTGFPGQLAQIQEAMEKAGALFNNLNIVILTHQDIDHVGTALDILNRLPDVKVLTHEEEKSFIEGECKPIKLAKLEEKLDSLPESMKEVYQKLKAGFEKSRVTIDNTLSDGEELPYCGGITVIYTPGHTPGHISLYLSQPKILIAGDLLCINDGVLLPTSPSTNFDTELSIKSIKKLEKYDIEKVVCYHGGLYTSEVNKRLAELANKK